MRCIAALHIIVILSSLAVIFALLCDLIHPPPLPPAPSTFQSKEGVDNCLPASSGNAREWPRSGDVRSLFCLDPHALGAVVADIASCTGLGGHCPRSLHPA